jgi:multiple sugar transport system permease protein
MADPASEVMATAAAGSGAFAPDARSASGPAAPTRRAPRRRNVRRILRRIGFAFAVLVIVSPAVLVFLWMLSLSLKNEIDNLAYPPVFIPSPPTLANYTSVFADNSMGLYFRNSLIVSGCATLLALAVGIPAGYGIARLQAHRTTIVILIARMTPALSFLIPLYMVFQFLGLNNTLTALVITHLVITVPIVVYVMAGYFETLPRELEEAALIDGGSVWSTFRYVALPLARPGIVVGTILAFIFSWNNFVFGAVLAGRATRTLPAAVYNVLTFEQLAWGPLAAAAIIVTLPVLVLTIFIQKEIVVGLTAGGIKA